MIRKTIACILVFCMLVLVLASCQQKTPIVPADEETTSPIEWVKPVESVDLDNMNLYWQHDNLQFAADSNALLSIYVRADKADDGQLVFDDGQDWAVLLETSLGSYPLFPRKYVQLGGVDCSVFVDTDNSFHVLITVQQTAGYQITDYIFDPDEKAFEVVSVYNAAGINFITNSM